MVDSLSGTPDPRQPRPARRITWILFTATRGITFAVLGRSDMRIFLVRRRVQLPRNHLLAGAIFFRGIRPEF